MKAWIDANRQAAVLVALTLAIPLCLLLYFSMDFMVLRAEYQREIDRLEPRIARLRGLVGSEAGLGSAAIQLDARLQGLVYPASQEPATVSAALQKNVREIAAEAGLTVSDSQVLKVVEEEGFERIGVKLTVSGSVAALETALQDLTTYVPLLLVESIEVFPDMRSRKRDAPPAQQVTASMQLLSLRALQ